MGTLKSGRRLFTALVVSIAMGLAGTVAHNQVAQAAEVDAIVPGSVKLTKNHGSDPLYLWSSAKLEADWKIPDGTGKAGDTFKITLPPELDSTPGSYELKDKDGGDLSYGTCVASVRELVCTLNANVEHKYNVGGSLWLDVQFIKTTDTNVVTLGVSGGGTVTTTLPDGQQGVGIRPYYPVNIFKDGWFMDDPTLIKWRVVVPGSQIQDVKEVAIVDNYGVEGVELTNSPNYPRVYALKATPECWSRIDTPGCLESLTATTDPAVGISVDDAKDRVAVDLKTATSFNAERVYVVEMQFKADRNLAEGTKWTNKATVNGKDLSYTTTKRFAGEGNGTGTEFAGLKLSKAVTGTGVVDKAQAFKVAYSYEHQGSKVEGVLEVKASGEVVELNDLPDGVVVTLTEQTPRVPGVAWGDPSFAGADVTDGGPNSASATVKVKGGLYSTVALTNPASKLVMVTPVTVKAGACEPGSTKPTPVVVTGAVDTDEIDYSDPELSVSGSTVTVTVTAKAKDGYIIDTANLPVGWSATADGMVKFTGSVQQPECMQKPSESPKPTATPTAKPTPKKPGLPKTGD